MSKVIADITMSLDGFVTGPDPGPEQGLGRGGEPLHTWAMVQDSEVDAEVLQASVDGTGAVILGRRLFDVVDAPDGWSEDMGYGGRHATRPPMFVVTHEAPEAVRLAAFFTFVTEGVEAAVRAAGEAAGDKDVFVMGGAEVIRQVVALGLADRVLLHLAPVLLGAGTRLFDGGELTQFEQVDVRVSPHAIHLTYAPA